MALAASITSVNCHCMLCYVTILLQCTELLSDLRSRRAQNPKSHCHLLWKCCAARRDVEEQMAARLLSSLFLRFSSTWGPRPSWDRRDTVDWYYLQHSCWQMEDTQFCAKIFAKLHSHKDVDACLSMQTLSTIWLHPRYILSLQSAHIVNINNGIRSETRSSSCNIIKEEQPFKSSDGHWINFGRANQRTTTRRWWKQVSQTII